MKGFLVAELLVYQEKIQSELNLVWRMWYELPRDCWTHSYSYSLETDRLQKEISASQVEPMFDEARQSPSVQGFSIVTASHDQLPQVPIRESQVATP